MATVADLADYLDRFAPPELAADWDNVGLLLGERSAPVARVLSCLTVTPESAAEAIEEGAQLVVTHHPVFFRAARRLTGDTPEGAALLALARAGVAVYSPHTAFDNTAGGINDALTARLGLSGVAPLRPRAGPAACKLVAFVPEADLARVSDALFAAGAGRIGRYRECSFRLPGTGTFFGGDDTNPTVGRRGRREEAAEWRLEVVCAERDVAAAVAALRAAHSYEEPAFDVYPLRPAAGGGGEGRLGELSLPKPLGEFAAATRTALGCGPVQVVGDPARPVRRVAVVCGAGGSHLGDAVAARADAFVTGEMRFHDYLAARAAGVGLVLPGHYATERFGVEELATRLQRDWPQLVVWPSRRETDPVAWA